MANNVIAQALGGEKKVLDSVSTVQDVSTRLGLSGGYTASVNGSSADFAASLDDGDIVTFAKAVKGGC
jgi:hypothetical protein